MSDQRDLFDRPPVDLSRCPTCERPWPKLRPRSIGELQARDLVALYRLTASSGEQWHHLRTFECKKVGGGDFAKLRLSPWFLVEEMPNDDDPTKRCKGIYRITDRGRAFVEGRLVLPSTILVGINSTSAGPSPKSKDIRIADIGPEFNFNWSRFLADSLPRGAA